MGVGFIAFRRRLRFSALHTLCWVLYVYQRYYCAYLALTADFYYLRGMIPYRESGNDDLVLTRKNGFQPFSVIPALFLLSKRRKALRKIERSKSMKYKKRWRPGGRERSPRIRSMRQKRIKRRARKGGVFA